MQSFKSWVLNLLRIKLELKNLLHIEGGTLFGTDQKKKRKTHKLDGKVSFMISLFKSKYLGKHCPMRAYVSAIKNKMNRLAQHGLKHTNGKLCIGSICYARMRKESSAIC